jgi:hypothetical protein
MWNRSLCESEVKDLHNTLPNDGLKINLNFNNTQDDNPDIHLFDLEWRYEDIKIPTNVLPSRRNGKFECLYHNDEGLINGEWAKGETTARNERRLITEMQTRNIDYKKDGFNKILNVIKLINIDETSFINTKIINVKTK